MSHIDWTNQYQFDNMLYFGKLKKSINNHNHYDEKQHQIICKSLAQKIKDFRIDKKVYIKHGD